MRAREGDEERTEREDETNDLSAALAAQQLALASPAVEAPAPAADPPQGPLAVRHARAGLVRVELARLDGEEDGAREEDERLRARGGLDISFRLTEEACREDMEREDDDAPARRCRPSDWTSRRRARRGPAPIGSPRGTAPAGRPPGPSCCRR